MAMQHKRIMTSLLAGIALVAISGCSPNQSVKTSEGNTIVTDGKPKVDSDTGMVSYKNAETGKTEQINGNRVKSMSELDN